jgi:hypothetical protein
VQKPLEALLKGEKRGPLEARHRRAFLAALEQDATQPGGDNARSLFAELDLAKKQMLDRIDEFIRLNVE